MKKHCFKGVEEAGCINIYRVSSTVHQNSSPNRLVSGQITIILAGQITIIPIDLEGTWD